MIIFLFLDTFLLKDTVCLAEMFAKGAELWWSGTVHVQQPSASRGQHFYSQDWIFESFKWTTG